VYVAELVGAIDNPEFVVASRGFGSFFLFRQDTESRKAQCRPHQNDAVLAFLFWKLVAESVFRMLQSKSVAVSVVHEKGFRHFDCLLLDHHCCVARRWSRVARGDPAHCANIAALDRYSAWHSSVRLEQVGCVSMFCLLAGPDGGNLAFSAWLGSRHLWNFLAD
jgi:hypothetical protein